MPLLRIDSARDSSSSGSKCRRGCSGLGSSWPMGRCRWERLAPAAGVAAVPQQRGEAAAEAALGLDAHALSLRWPWASPGLRRALVAAQQLAGKQDIGLPARAADIIEQRRLAMGGASAMRTLRGIAVSKTFTPKSRRTSAATCHIVSPVVHGENNALDFQSGFKFCFTRSTVLMS